jgi:hypothetical protein
MFSVWDLPADEGLACALVFPRFGAGHQAAEPENVVTHYR